MLQKARKIGRFPPSGYSESAVKVDRWVKSSCLLRQIRSLLTFKWPSFRVFKTNSPQILSNQMVTFFGKRESFLCLPSSLPVESCEPSKSEDDSSAEVHGRLGFFTMNQPSSVGRSSKEFSGLNSLEIGENWVDFWSQFLNTPIWWDFVVRNYIQNNHFLDYERTNSQTTPRAPSKCRHFLVVELQPFSLRKDTKIEIFGGKMRILIPPQTTSFLECEKRPKNSTIRKPPIRGLCGVGSELVLS